MPNRRLVLDFFNEALVAKRPASAFSRFVAPDFVDHKPDILGGTRDNGAAFLQGLMDELPEARWEIVRTVAEHDLVVLHVRFRPSPDASPYAIVDIFRVAEGTIVEHWDVVSPPTKLAVNPHPRI